MVYVKYCVENNILSFSVDFRLLILCLFLIAKYTVLVLSRSNIFYQSQIHHVI